MRIFGSLVTGLALLVLAGCHRSASQQELQALDAKLAKAPAPTRDFYAARKNVPAWVIHGKATSDARDLLELLAAAGDEGLDPAEYQVDDLERRVASVKGDAGAAMDLELALSTSLMRYATHLASGHPIAKKIDPGWTPAQRKLEVAKVVAEAVDDGDLDELPKALEPRHAEYARLKDLLQSARAAKPPDAHRVRQIELNMERWRWLPDDLGSPRIVVNVPAFELQVREGDDVRLQMKVIVGKDTNRTPIFSDEMTSVVFSPYWNIPQSIEMKEMLPKILEDEGFLEKNEMEVVRKGQVVSASDIDWDDLEDEGDIQLRQRPGAENALGYVKFLFPNRHNVYLHDTPNDNLFDKLTRDLSHGCVRVEKPVDLAQYVLRDKSEWTPERIDEAMHAGKEKHVALKEKLPVHIVYLTVRAREGGEPQFFEDVYGYDARQAELW